MADYKLRRSLLYVPGNMPSMLQNIPLFQCDAVQIDLEDAVPLAANDASAFHNVSFSFTIPYSFLATTDTIGKLCQRR